MEKHWQQLIDKFVNQTLTESEQEEYDLLYTTEFDFKKHADFIKDLKIVAAVQDQNDFKELLTSIEAENCRSKNNTSYRSLWLTAAAIAAVLVMVLYVYKFTTGAKSHEQLYATYFTPHANTLAPIERGETALTVLEEAFFAYENNNYKQAITLFNLVDEIMYPDVVFFKASAHMAIEQHRTAIPLLKSYAEKDAAYATYSHWYLALCYLKTDQLPPARSQLQLIVKNQYYPAKKAAALLKELD